MGAAFAALAPLASSFLPVFFGTPAALKEELDSTVPPFAGLFEAVDVTETTTLTIQMDTIFDTDFEEAVCSDIEAEQTECDAVYSASDGHLIVTRVLDTSRGIIRDRSAQLGKLVGRRASVSNWTAISTAKVVVRATYEILEGDTTLPEHVLGECELAIKNYFDNRVRSGEVRVTAASADYSEFFSPAPPPPGSMVNPSPSPSTPEMVDPPSPSAPPGSPSDDDEPDPASSPSPPATNEVTQTVPAAQFAGQSALAVIAAATEGIEGDATAIVTQVSEIQFVYTGTLGPVELLTEVDSALCGGRPDCSVAAARRSRSLQSADPSEPSFSFTVTEVLQGNAIVQGDADMTSALTAISGVASPVVSSTLEVTVTTEAPSPSPPPPPVVAISNDQGGPDDNNDDLLGLLVLLLLPILVILGVFIYIRNKYPGQTCTYLKWRTSHSNPICTCCYYPAEKRAEMLQVCIGDAK